MKRQSVVAFIFAGFVAVLTAGVASAGGKPDGASCHVHKSCRSGSCIRQSPADKFGKCCAAQDCAALGAQCGEIDNGCGLPIQCGVCGPGATCVNNTCEVGTTTTSSTTTSTSTSTSTSSTSTTSTTSTTVPSCSGLTCPFNFCNEVQDCYTLQTTDTCGVCAHNFFCGVATACTSPADCGPGQVCVVDSCCGVGTGRCTDLCDATTTTTTSTTTTSTTLDPCANGTQDGDETGTDCGGSCGATCLYGAGCDDDGDCTSGACAAGACRDKLVFVTSQSYTGNLGGLAGADTKCNVLATNAGLGGTWVAWLSTSGGSAISRIVDQQYRNTNGEVAFTSKFFMSIVGAWVAINYDEFGNSTGSDLAWTASNAVGLQRPDTCSDWASTSGEAGTGNPSVSNEWSLSGVATSPCTESHRLICFEN